MSRDHNFEHHKVFDLAIIGGGSHGAALAWEASKAGYSVCLLEQNDFGSGTSANSLKIIHGGIRYLQSLSLDRLFYSTKERSFLLKTFPHLVEPLECLLPTQNKLTKNKLVVGAAFKLYDLLTPNKNIGISQSRKISNTYTLAKKEFLNQFPNVIDSNFTGGAAWFDAQVYNTERLIFSYAMSAKLNGACILNYCQAKKLRVENEKVIGIDLVDLISNEKHSIESSVVIDASGPWDFSRNYMNDNSEKYTYAKAVNVVLNRSLLKKAIGLTIPASEEFNLRLLFYTPWKDCTIAGTWYFSHKGCAQNSCEVSEAELNKIIDDINTQFKDEKITRQDITLVHEGLLPVKPIHSSEMDPELISESVIFGKQELGLDSYYAVQGTKLTTARVTALKCLRRCFHEEALHSIKTAIKIEAPSIYGAHFDNYHEFLNRYIVECSDIWSENTICRLVRNFGSNIRMIHKLARETAELAQSVPGSMSIPKAEIRYIIENELVYSLSDLLFRRCDIGSIKIPAKETIEYCMCELENRFHWSSEEKEQNIAEFRELYPVWARQ